MKRVLIILLSLSFILPAYAAKSARGKSITKRSKTVHVKSYNKKNGTHVQSHRLSAKRR